jgi:phosphodiesterase/alkaline phosphatase D-like protein
MKTNSLLASWKVMSTLTSWMILLFVFIHPVSAQTGFTGTYVQNFNSMGTGSTIPSGWSHIGSLGGSNSSWSSSIPGSGSPSAASTGTTNNSLIVATNSFSGTSNTRAYNYSGSTTSDRALGTSPTTGAGNILQLRLTNNTGAAISALQISYDIRRFATGSSAETLPGYWLFISVNNGSTWTEVTSLKPTSATLPNTNGTSNFSQTVNLPSAVASGTEIRFRWVDDNSTSSSPDQRIGLDNINIVNTAAAACGTPSGLTATGISASSASLSWVAVSGATSYNLQWKLSSGSTFTTISNLSSSSYLLSGLAASTNYTWQVQAVCGTTTGSYSSPATFTTTATGGTLNEVIYIWSGALQPTSATVVAKMTSASTTCRIAVSTSPSITNPVYSAFAAASSINNNMAKMNISGLQPNTQYYYAVESNGVLDNSSDDIGRFKTPGSGAYSFSFAHGSCSGNGNHGVFTAIQNKNPLFFLETGDIHYADPNSSNIATHRAPYENNVLSRTAISTLFKNTAMAYMWDDHDYCGNNNSGSNQTGTANARQAYQEYVPHYPLVAGSGNVPIYQAFTIGRIRFILADLRSLRASGTMFGTTQKNWFKQECLNARDNCQVIAWVTGTSFGGNQSDNWGGFTAERTELSNFFRDNNIQNMFIMSGDAHLLAIDNGSNHDFSTGSNNPYDYPVFSGAGLNQSGSNKGGTYSQGAFPNPSSTTGQYGIIEVIDNGGSSISFNFKGYRTNGNTSTDAIQVSYSFTRTLCSSPLASGSFEPHFSARLLDQGESVKLNWKATSDEELTLVRVTGNDKSHVLKRGAEAFNEFTDNHPESGWNNYQIRNQHGEVIANKEVFAKGKSELKIHPNPASEYFTLQLPKTDDLNNGHILIYNAAQICVGSYDVNFDMTKTSDKINISELPAGLYTILFQSNGLNLTKSLIITK